MKKWEEEQRKKAHNKRVIQAKPTLKTQQASAQSVSVPRDDFMSAGVVQAGSNVNFMPQSNQFTSDSISKTTNDYGRETTANGSIYSKPNGPFITTANSIMQSNKASVVRANNAKLGNIKKNYEGSTISSGPTPFSTTSMNGQQNSAKAANNNRKQSLNNLDRDITELPIYQLLRAFNLQQYTRKLSDSGYADDVYKLALLNHAQRDDLLNQLKCMPGHRAKLLGVFQVIDEIYPRSLVIDQIKAATPENQRISSMPFKPKQTRDSQASAMKDARLPALKMQNNRYPLHPAQAQGISTQMGPQKTLLQKYEQLDLKTKKEFNSVFLQTLEQATQGNQSLSQLMGYGGGGAGISSSNTSSVMKEVHARVDSNLGNINTSVSGNRGSAIGGYNIINEIFPPSMFSYGQDVIDQMNQKDVAEDVDAALKKFVKPNFAIKSQVRRRQQVDRLSEGQKPRRDINSIVPQSLNQASSSKIDQDVIGLAEQTYSSKQIQSLCRSQRLDEDSSKKVLQMDQMDSPSKFGQEGFNSKNLLVPINVVNSEQQMKNADLDVPPLMPPPYAIMPDYMGQNNQVNDMNNLQMFDPNASALNIENQTMTSGEINLVLNSNQIQLQQQSSSENNNDPNQFAEQVNTRNNNDAVAIQDQNNSSNIIEDDYADDPDHSKDNITSQQSSIQVVPQQSQDSSILYQQQDTSQENVEESQGGAIIWPSQQNAASSQQARAKASNMTPIEKVDIRAPLAKIPAFKGPKNHQKHNNQQQSTERPWSSLIDKSERDKAWKEGHSMDKKQMTEALGFLDMKQICYCLAHAVMKHIEFGQGFLFLSDLQDYKKRSFNEEEIKNEKLEFTYGMGEMKIDVMMAQQRINDKSTKDKEKGKKDTNAEFLKLKEAMEAQSTPLSDVNNNPKTLAVEPQKSSDSIIEEENMQQPLPNNFTTNNNNNVEEDIIDCYEEDEDFVMEDEILNTPNKVAEDQCNLDANVSQFQLNQRDKSNADFGLTGTENGGDCDLDYSQTHLEDFLKSQTKGTYAQQLQSGQLLSSFMTTVNKHSQVGTIGGVNGGRNTGGSTLNLLGSNGPNNLSAARLSHKNGTQMNEIKEDQESQSSEKPKVADLEDSDDEEALNRTDERIDLNTVDVQYGSTKTREKAKAQQVEAEKKQEADQNPTDSTDAIQLDMRTKQGLREALAFQMRIFDYNYDFEKDELNLNTRVENPINPTLEELYYYCKYVIITGRMEKEIPILCLIYLERFTQKTGLLINWANWKRLVLISLVLASKIWDDDSLENVHFPQVMSDISLKEISGLEQVFLRFIDFDLVIRGAEYAKYYFILKTFSQDFKSVLPMGPLGVEHMKKLQNNTVKAESELRDKYKMRLQIQKTM